MSCDCGRLNYLLAGGSHPIGFHVLNIVLHSIISTLMIDVFAILIGGLAYDGKLQKLNQAPKASFLAALIFAAHPVHTESVSIVMFYFTSCPLFTYFCGWEVEAWTQRAVQTMINNMPPSYGTTMLVAVRLRHHA